MDNGNRFLRLAIGGTAAEGKIRDIDFVRAKNGADLPDDARDIAVAQVNEIALERRLDVNAVDIEQTRRAFMKHRACHKMLFAAGTQKQRQHASGASLGALRLARFVNRETLRLRDGSSVYQIGFFFQSLVQDAFDRGIANQFGLPLGDVPAVAQRNFLESPVAGLRYKGS